MASRRTLLTLTVVGLVPAFVIVNGLVALARGTREALEREWASRGAIDFAAGRAREAADDFRAAQIYARGRGRYRLELARALAAAGRPLEARAELETLWSDEPGDGIVNLELARVEAASPAREAAVRHYHGAIDGAWEQDPAAARRAARLELARFLAGRGQLPQAEAELSILLADAPIDPGAAALAGRIAFARGDFRSAAERLRRARDGGALDADAASMLDVSLRAFALDPAARGITSRERMRRIVRVFGIALAAARRCTARAAAPMRARLEAAAPAVTDRALGRDPDAIDATLELATAAESVVAAACPGGDADARALALLLRRTASP